MIPTLFETRSLSRLARFVRGVLLRATVLAVVGLGGAAPSELAEMSEAEASVVIHDECLVPRMGHEGRIQRVAVACLGSNHTHTRPHELPAPPPGHARGHFLANGLCAPQRC